MRTLLRILMIEDSEDDALLIVNQIKKGQTAKATKEILKVYQLKRK